MDEYLDQYEEHELTKVYDRDIARRLVRYARPYARWIVCGFVLTLVAEGARNGTPLVAMRAIDRFIETRALQGMDLWAAFLALRWVLALYFGLLALDLAAAFVKDYVMGVMGLNIMRDMRMEVFRHLHRLQVAFFDNTAVGRLMTRVMNDVAALNELFREGIVDSLGSVVGLTIVVVMMFVVNWKLALVTFAVLPVIGAATFVFQVVSRRAYREWRRQLSRLNAYMNERITGLATVQLFHQEDATASGFRDINRQYRDAAVRGVFAMAFFMPLVEIAGGLAGAVIIWYGGGQVVQQSVTIGELYAFLAWGHRFFWPLRRLSAQYNTLLIAMASSERIFHILNTQPTIVESTSVRAVPSLSREIEFRDVWFAYQGDDYVLRDVNLTIRKGEKVAVVGATGAGKTTLTNLLCRFYDIQKGRILFDGVDIRDLRLDDLRQRLAIVQQDVFLFSGTVRENIRLGNEAISDEQIWRAAEHVQAHRFIESLPGGYDAEVREGGATFSVGQKQLIAFARAVAFDPDVLILDEATSSVDTETELLIQEGLKRLLEGRTSIIIAHRLSTIQDADKIVVMHKGAIREMGTHAELLREQGIYYRLYRLQYRDQETSRIAGKDQRMASS
jgi:ATP-binding cassette subfamily B protein